MERVRPDLLERVWQVSCLMMRMLRHSLAPSAPVIAEQRHKDQRATANAPHDQNFFQHGESSLPAPASSMSRDFEIVTTQTGEPAQWNHFREPENRAETEAG